MAKVKYNYKYATCEVLVLKDKESGETEERTFTLPHTIKNVNDRTKSRILKEINDGGYLSSGEEAIYIKSAIKGVKIMEADLNDFLTIAVESAEPEIEECLETEDE